MSTPTLQAYEAAIADLVSKHGEVPPLWARWPRVHPSDGHWRMGSGEWYRDLFAAWKSSRGWSEAEWLEYFRRWDPPSSWLESVAWTLWPGDFFDQALDVTEERWAQLEQLGFGSFADWERCFNVAPEDYPLPDDTCSAWLPPEDQS